MEQQHLSVNEMTNLGCFYTPEVFIDKLIEIVNRNVANADEFFFVDTSCGYGAFLSALRGKKTVGCDIDKTAVEKAAEIDGNSKYYVLNSLKNFSRESIGLTDNDKIIIVGNPPYNDVTSQVKNGIKNATPCEIDEDLKRRDLGSSFLLSYDKIKADYVAVLHPLSYLIKKANFNSLTNFFKNYRLTDHCVINSQGFSDTSKSNGFPIIIALYSRDERGTTYQDALDTTYRTIENATFSVKIDSIANYVQKYPQKNARFSEDDVLFYTLRDVNALKRSRTFITEPITNAVKVDKSVFEYYAYIDNFKDYCDLLPYYLGNCDVFIDDEEFKPIKDVFVTKSLLKHSFLKNKISNFNENSDFGLIDRYFEKLFGAREGSFHVQERFCEQKCKIKISVPLTNPNGKFRIKECKQNELYSAKVYTRTQKISGDCYLEWQIGYDVTVKNYIKKTGEAPDVVFVGYNGKQKTLFELSAFIAEFYKKGALTKNQLENLKNQLQTAAEKPDCFIENRSEFKPRRKAGEDCALNGLTFSTSSLEYPTLHHHFEKGGFSAEITVREQQRAAGVQPMLYLCFPVSALKSEIQPLVGRTAFKKECASLTFDANAADDLLSLLALFGMMSKAHNGDATAILKAILQSNP